MVLFDGPAVRDSGNIFVDAGTFTCEDSLIDPEAAGRDGQDSAVGRNLVTDGYRDNITRDQFRRMYAANVSRAKDLGLIWRVLLQRLQCTVSIETRMMYRRVNARLWLSQHLSPE